MHDGGPIDVDGGKFVGVDGQGLVVRSGFLHEVGAGGGSRTVLPRLDPRSDLRVSDADDASRREAEETD